MGTFQTDSTFYVKLRRSKQFLVNDGVG